MKFRLFALIAIFLGFTAYSLLVVANHGYVSFLEVATAGGWATQVFIDLCVALTAFAVWMFGDAKARGIPAWPYFVAILGTGSVGALAYLIHRTLREENRSQMERPATA